MKKCSKCDKEKPLDQFYNNKHTKSGLTHQCKDCCKKRVKIYANKNKPKILKYAEKYRKENFSKIKKYKENNKSKSREYSREYLKKNREKIMEYRKNTADHIKEYRKKYEEMTNYNKRYYEKNKEKIKKSASKYILHKRKTDINYKIKNNLRTRIYHVLKDGCKSAKTMELLGCTIEEFKIHIKKQFKNGMKWDNHGHHGWHIDHIKPCASFDLSDPEQQKECFHYSNMQPLWAEENLSKGAKYDIGD